MISIICPTRNRPENLKRLITNLHSTANLDNLQFIFYIDNDDIQSEAAIIYCSTLISLSDHKTLNYEILRGPRVFFSQMLNEAYKLCKHDIIFMIGDDMIIHNKGWDKRIIDIFDASKDKILLVYGPDGYQPRTFGTHVFVHRNWINIQGSLMPINVSSDFGDTWYNDIADIIGRKIILDDFGLEHLHPLAGKAPYDPTYTDRITAKNIYRPDKIFEESKEQRDLVAKKLQDFINASNTK